MSAHDSLQVMRRSQGPAFATTNIVSKTACCERGPQALGGLLHLAEVAATFNAPAAAATAADSTTGSPHRKSLAAGHPACSLPQPNVYQRIPAFAGSADACSSVPTTCMPLQRNEQLQSLNPAQQHDTASASSPRQQDGTVGAYRGAVGVRNAHHSLLAASLAAIRAAPHQLKHAPPAAGRASTQSPMSARVGTSAAGVGPSHARDTNLLADVISKMEPGNAAVVLAALGTWSNNVLGVAAPPAASAVQHSTSTDIEPEPAPAGSYDTDDDASDSVELLRRLEAGRPQRWSEEEHAQLEALVEQYGTKSWSAVAAHLPGRTGKQCRERYINHKAKLKKVRSNSAYTAVRT